HRCRSGPERAQRALGDAQRRPWPDQGEARAGPKASILHRGHRSSCGRLMIEGSDRAETHPMDSLPENCTPPATKAGAWSALLRLPAQLVAARAARTAQDGPGTHEDGPTEQQAILARGASRRPAGAFPQPSRMADRSVGEARRGLSAVRPVAGTVRATPKRPDGAGLQ